MEQVEIEPLVSELEGRVDRLRSLYDMYFMGIERMEPLVPRKDVERRLAILRKEQIRNTGVRFRFQMIIQRYNTYVTYWQRITRQIETGTFKRHVMRATARFGVDPTKEQVVTPSKEEAANGASAKGADAVPDSAPVAVMPDKPIEEVYELDVDVDLDVVHEEEDPFRVLGPAPGAPRVPPERFASAVKFELDDLADPFEEADPFPKPAERKAIPPRIAPRTNIPAAGDPIEGDLRIPPAAGSRPIVTKRSSLPDAPPMDMATAQAMLRGQALPPPRMSGQPGPLPMASPSKAPPPEAPARRPGTLLPGTGAAPRVALPGQTNVPVAPSILPGAGPAGAPRIAPQVARAGATTAPGPVPPRAAPAPTVAPGTMRSPSIVVRPATPPGASASAPGTGPTVRPAPMARPTVQPAAAPTASLAPKAPANVGDLSGDRFGEIYSKYVETRRQHNEPTHAITRDALAKQLNESTDRLKQKTGAKAVDFEVVVKDGRTILRPIVK